MTEQELELIIKEMTPEKMNQINERVDELLDLNPEKNTKEYEELLDLLTIKEAIELIEFHTEYVHVKEIKRLLWSYTAIITAVFSVLFAIFMRK
jgi:hypothetical protein